MNINKSQNDQKYKKTLKQTLLEMSRFYDFTRDIGTSKQEKKLI